MNFPSDTSSDESCKSTCNKNSYVCTYDGCKASFSKNSKLLYHIRRHTGERPFACDEPNCSKTYLYSFHLRRHKETYHNNSTVERIRCPYEGCYFELANKYTLKKHIKRKHNPERQYPFNCGDCGQGFHKKKQLLQHSFVHTGVSHFKCDSCELVFPTLRDRNRHKRTHTRYSCKCGETFERWTDLLAHKKTCEIAKPKCNICNKTFTQGINFKTHLSVHSKETGDVYICGYDNCTRLYLYKKNLIYHIDKCHKKIALPRIACTQPGCQKTFTRKQSLQYHITSCHSNDKSKRLKKPRSPRKDKGTSRKSTAAVLAGLELPLKIHRSIIDRASVKLPPVSPEDTLATKSISNREEPNGNNSKDIEKEQETVLEGIVKKLKSKVEENLLKRFDENNSRHSSCSMSDNESSQNCVKVLC